jgi:glucose/arabinose dehydrogenase
VLITMLNRLPVARILLIAAFALLATGPMTLSVSAQKSSFDPGAYTLKTETLVDGLDSPLDLVDANDGTGRMFIVEKGGRVLILKDGQVQPDPFLDISSQVRSSSEQGLLSIALHPDFKTNGTFFIDYTDTDGNSQLERWTVSKDNPDVADPSSAETILSQDQPFPNHNGGLLMFGPDGYLYIGFGDGGSGGDPHGNAQNLDTLLGKILRIDVDHTEGDLAYAIPKDNPFVGQEGARGEIWAYGLRNPWRFSFDRETGDLYIADVGQGQYEEADFDPAGKGGLNFGWVTMEGPHCYQQENCNQTGLTLPFFSYTHDFGCSITGGYVYRGKAIPDLVGAYLAADYCSGLVWAVNPETGKATEPMQSNASVSSFAEDAEGELYMIDLNGAILKIVP